MTREQLDYMRSRHRELEHLMDRHTIIEGKLSASPATDVPKVKTSVTNKAEMYLCLAADISTNIDMIEAELDVLAAELEADLDAADLTLDEHQVMRLRYVYALNWDDIATCMYWSTRKVQQLHGSALVKMGI